ncbi:MAG: hypothetical protein SVZ03_13545 [Spirochaetota bacterium]|nr:hypothetical protein [Spirochaetota bacterium]
MRKFIVLLGVLVFSIFFSIEGFANFADTHGMSASGIARGNAMTAIASDWSATYYNIAGLGKTKRNSVESKDTGDSASEGDKKYDLTGLHDQLAISYFYTNPDFEIDIPRETRMDEDLEAGIVCIGIAFDLNNIYKMPDFISSSRFGLALGLMADKNIAKINDIDIKTHTFLRYGRELSAPAIIAGLGLGFMDDLFAIGFGANVLVGGEGAIKMDSVTIGNEDVPLAYQVKIDVGPEIAPVLGLYMNVGELTSILEGLEFGLAYKGEVYVEIDPLDAVAQTQLLDIELELTLGVCDYYTPDIYSFGIAYTPPFISKLTVSADYEFQKYSDYKLSSTRHRYWEEERTTPENYVNYELPDFQDIFVPKLGVSYEFNQWLTLLGGYYYQPAFVEDDANNGIFNFLDNDKRVFSIGSEFIIPKMAGMVVPIQFNIGFQYQQLIDRDVHKLRLDNSIALSESSGPSNYWNLFNPDYSYGGSNYLVTCEVIIRM